MTEEKILRKVIEIAKKYGYTKNVLWDDQMDQPYISDKDGGYFIPSNFEIIFDHDFAKALAHYILKENLESLKDEHGSFGISELRKVKRGARTFSTQAQEDYVYGDAHEYVWKRILLQRMVLEENPLHYLIPFLEDERISQD